MILFCSRRKSGKVGKLSFSFTFLDESHLMFFGSFSSNKLLIVKFDSSCSTSCALNCANSTNFFSASSLMGFVLLIFYIMLSVSFDVLPYLSSNIFHVSSRSSSTFFKWSYGISIRQDFPV